MICVKCQLPIETSQIAPRMIIDEATELRVECECGAGYYAFVQHTEWFTDGNGDNVNLGAKPTKKKGGRS